jgi:Tfp pilus assembly protein PilF
LWRTAESQLEQAAGQLPLFPDYQLNLARLYATRARLDTDTNREELLQSAHAQYSAALNLSPRNGAIWNEYASVVYNQEADCDEAYTLYRASAEGDPFYARTYVEIASLQLECSPDDTPTLTYQEVIARLRQALFRVSVATTPQTWEQLAQQHSDLASFEAALASYEQERSETWQAAKARLDQAESSLTAGNEGETDAQLEEALVLFRQLVAQ